LVFLPKGTIPNSIQLPSKFNAKGFFKGTIANFNTNMNIASSFEMQNQSYIRPK
jgi:hypothetical protein